MSGSVLHQVARNELDVGFYLGLPPDSASNQPLAVADKALLAVEFEAKVLTHFTYRVVAPAGWGPQVRGHGWRGLAALPWLATPPASVHQRLLATAFGPLGLEPKRVALVDQEASMLDLVKSGVGLSLVRDSIAIRESQAHGLVVADRVSLDCVLSFVCLQSRVADPVVAAAWKALETVWR